MTTVAAPPAAPRSLRKWLPLLALVVVAVAALVIGTRPHHHSATIEQRTMSIANQIRCPVCSGETAAQSDTPSSVNIRTFIAQKLRAGQSRSQILRELEASYGSSSLERPPARGANLLLWFIPLLAVVLAGGGLVLVFRRWRLSRADGASDEDQRLVGGALGRSDGFRLPDDEEGS